MRCGLVRLVTRKSPFDIKTRKKGWSTLFKNSENGALCDVAESKIIGRCCAHKMCRLVEKSSKFLSKLITGNESSKRKINNFKVPMLSHIDQIELSPGVIRKDFSIYTQRVQNLTVKLSNSKPNISRSLSHCSKTIRFRENGSFSHNYEDLRSKQPKYIQSKSMIFPIKRHSTRKFPFNKYDRVIAGPKFMSLSGKYSNHRRSRLSCHCKKEYSVESNLNCYLQRSKLYCLSQDFDHFEEPRCEYGNGLLNSNVLNHLNETSYLSLCGCDICERKLKTFTKKSNKINKLLNNKINKLINYCKKKNPFYQDSLQYSNDISKKSISNYSTNRVGTDFKQSCSCCENAGKNHNFKIKTRESSNSNQMNDAEYQSYSNPYRNNYSLESYENDNRNARVNFVSKSSNDDLKYKLDSKENYVSNSVNDNLNYIEYIGHIDDVSNTQQASNAYKHYDRHSYGDSNRSNLNFSQNNQVATCRQQEGNLSEFRNERVISKDQYDNSSDFSKIVPNSVYSNNEINQTNQYEFGKDESIPKELTDKGIQSTTLHSINNSGTSNNYTYEFYRGTEQINENSINTPPEYWNSNDKSSGFNKNTNENNPVIDEHTNNFANKQNTFLENQSNSQYEIKDDFGNLEIASNWYSYDSDKNRNLNREDTSSYKQNQQSLDEYSHSNYNEIYNNDQSNYFSGQSYQNETYQSNDGTLNYNDQLNDRGTDTLNSPVHFNNHYSPPNYTLDENKESKANKQSCNNNNCDQTILNFDEFMNIKTRELSNDSESNNFRFYNDFQLEELTNLMKNKDDEFVNGNLLKDSKPTEADSLNFDGFSSANESKRYQIYDKFKFGYGGENANEDITNGNSTFDPVNNFITNNVERYNKRINLTRGPDFSIFPESNWKNSLNKCGSKLLSETVDVSNPILHYKPIKVRKDESSSLSRYSEINLAIQKVKRKIEDIVNDSEDQKIINEKSNGSEDKLLESPQNYEILDDYERKYNLKNYSYDQINNSNENQHENNTNITSVEKKEESFPHYQEKFEECKKQEDSPIADTNYTGNNLENASNWYSYDMNSTNINNSSYLNEFSTHEVSKIDNELNNNNYGRNNQIDNIEQVKDKFDNDYNEDNNQEIVYRFETQDKFDQCDYAYQNSEHAPSSVHLNDIIEAMKGTSPNEKNNFNDKPMFEEEQIEMIPNFSGYKIYEGKSDKKNRGKKSVRFYENELSYKPGTERLMTTVNKDTLFKRAGCRFMSTSSKGKEIFQGKSDPEKKLSGETPFDDLLFQRNPDSNNVKSYKRNLLDLPSSQYVTQLITKGSVGNTRKGKFNKVEYKPYTLDSQDELYNKSIQTFAKINSGMSDFEKNEYGYSTRTGEVKRNSLNALDSSDHFNNRQNKEVNKTFWKIWNTNDSKSTTDNSYEGISKNDKRVMGNGKSEGRNEIIFNEGLEKTDPTEGGLDGNCSRVGTVMNNEKRWGTDRVNCLGNNRPATDDFKCINVGDVGLNFTSFDLDKWDNTGKRVEKRDGTEKSRVKDSVEFQHGSGNNINNGGAANTSMSAESNLHLHESRALGLRHKNEMSSNSFKMRNPFSIDGALRPVSSTSMSKKQDETGILNNNNISLKHSLTDKLKNIKNIENVKYVREEKSLVDNETVDTIKIKESFESMNDGMHSVLNQDEYSAYNLGLCSKEFERKTHNKLADESNITKQITEEMNVSGQFTDGKKTFRGKTVTFMEVPISKVTALKGKENEIKSLEKNKDVTTTAGVQKDFKSTEDGKKVTFKFISENEDEADIESKEYTETDDQNSKSWRKYEPKSKEKYFVDLKKLNKFSRTKHNDSVIPRARKDILVWEAPRNKIFENIIKRSEERLIRKSNESADRSSNLSKLDKEKLQLMEERNRKSSKKVNEGQQNNFLIDERNEGDALFKNSRSTTQKAQVAPEDIQNEKRIFINKSSYLENKEDVQEALNKLKISYLKNNRESLFENKEETKRNLNYEIKISKEDRSEAGKEPESVVSNEKSRDKSVNSQRKFNLILAEHQSRLAQIEDGKLKFKEEENVETKLPEETVGEEKYEIDSPGNNAMFEEDEKLVVTHFKQFHRPEDDHSLHPNKHRQNNFVLEASMLKVTLVRDRVGNMNRKVTEIQPVDTLSNEVERELNDMVSPHIDDMKMRGSQVLRTNVLDKKGNVKSKEYYLSLLDRKSIIPAQRKFQEMDRASSKVKNTVEETKESSEKPHYITYTDQMVNKYKKNVNESKFHSDKNTYEVNDSTRNKQIDFNEIGDYNDEQFYMEPRKFHFKNTDETLESSSKNDSVSYLEDAIETNLEQMNLAYALRASIEKLYMKPVKNEHHDRIEEGTSQEISPSTDYPISRDQSNIEKSRLADQKIINDQETKEFHKKLRNESELRENQAPSKTSEEAFRYETVAEEIKQIFMNSGNSGSLIKDNIKEGDESTKALDNNIAQSDFEQRKDKELSKRKLGRDDNVKVKMKDAEDIKYDNVTLESDRTSTMKISKDDNDRVVSKSFDKQINSLDDDDDVRKHKKIERNTHNYDRIDKIFSQLDEAQDSSENKLEGEKEIDVQEILNTKIKMEEPSGEKNLFEQERKSETMDEYRAGTSPKVNEEQLKLKSDLNQQKEPSLFENEEAASSQVILNVKDKDFETSHEEVINQDEPKYFNNKLEMHEKKDLAVWDKEPTYIKNLRPDFYQKRMQEKRNQNYLDNEAKFQTLLIKNKVNALGKSSNCKVVDCKKEKTKWVADMCCSLDQQEASVSSKATSKIGDDQSKRSHQGKTYTFKSGKNSYKSSDWPDTLSRKKEPVIKQPISPRPPWRR